MGNAIVQVNTIAPRRKAALAAVCTELPVRQGFRDRFQEELIQVGAWSGMQRCLLILPTETLLRMECGCWMEGDTPSRPVHYQPVLSLASGWLIH